MFVGHDGDPCGEGIGHRQIEGCPRFDQAVLAYSQVGGAVEFVKSRRFGDDVDAPTGRVLTEQRSLRAPQYLDSLQIEKIGLQCER